MATKNAPFYSCKAGRPDTVKSHRTRAAALKSAGEQGVIYETERDSERQVHRACGGGWITEAPTPGLTTKLKKALIEFELISPSEYHSKPI